MRFTQAQYEQLLNRKRRDKCPESEFRAANDDCNQDKKERAKFRKHIRNGEYEFCDSYMMEGQGHEKTI